MGPHATSLSHQCPMAQPSFTGQPHWKYSSQVGATSASAVPTVLTPPPLWNVVPSQALLLSPGLSLMAAAVALLYLAPTSCLTVPPVHGAQLPVGHYTRHTGALSRGLS